MSPLPGGSRYTPQLVVGLGSISLLAASLGVAITRNPPGNGNVLGSLSVGVGLALVFSVPIVLQTLLVRSRLAGWVTGMIVLIICAWIAVALLTGDSVANLHAVTYAMLFGVVLLLFLSPLFIVLLFIRPHLIAGLVGFVFLSIGILATAALLLSDARLITASVPLIVVACVGGIVIDGSSRRRAA